MANGPAHSILFISFQLALPNGRAEEIKKELTSIGPLCGVWRAEWSQQSKGSTRRASFFSSIKSIIFDLIEKRMKWSEGSSKAKTNQIQLMKSNWIIDFVFVERSATNQQTFLLLKKEKSEVELVAPPIAAPASRKQNQLISWNSLIVVLLFAAAAWLIH